MTLRIVGAGIAGLLAANMLRHRKPQIVERQDALPNNHSAVLRFRSRVISDVTGIEFRKVQAIKATLPWKNSIADALAYSDKNSGMMRSDRSLSTETNTVERYIAPPDLIERLAADVNIRYGVSMSVPCAPFLDEFPSISTIPMPVLMDILGYTCPIIFKSISGTNLIAKIARCDAYVSLYTPSPFYPFSRISLTGDELVAEVPTVDVEDPEIIYAAASLLGIERDRLSGIEVKTQRYAKIIPIDDAQRKRFIAWASDEHGIYSLGRYACWRPGLLLDDLVQDIRLIERWIGGHDYARKLHDNTDKSTRRPI